MLVSTGVSGCSSRSAATQTSAAQTTAEQTEEGSAENTDSSEAADESEAAASTDDDDYTTVWEATDNGDYKENTRQVEHVNHEVTDDNAPVVYFTSDISPEGLQRVYEALGKTLSGKVAVKLSTGEPGGHNFLDPPNQGSGAVCRWYHCRV